MPNQPLVFRRLSIRRLPGLSHGLADYLDFSPHINIILGPNGSGKSSTAKVLCDLLWRQGTDEVVARSLLAVGNKEWEASIDGRRTTCMSNGTAEALPGIPAPESRKRYTLALHELITADDVDLAQLVVNASTGYDLNAAERALGYWLGGISTATNLYKGYVNAKKIYDDISKSQQALQIEQKKLQELLVEKEDAENAAALLRWNQQLLEFVRSRTSLAEARSKLAVFPEVLAALSGHELSELDRLKEQREGLRSKWEEETNQITAAEGRKLALQFPENGLKEGLTIVLEAKIARLADLERAISEDERAVADAKVQEQEALRKLGTEADIPSWEGVSWENLDELNTSLRHFHQVLSRKDAMAALVKTYEESNTLTELPAPEDLLVGIRTLLAWLKEQDTQQKQLGHAPIWTIWLLAGLGIISTLVVLLLGRVGLAAIILILGGIALAYSVRNKKRGNRTPDRRSEYEQLPLLAVPEWSEPIVSNQLKTLADQLSDAHWQQKVKGRLEVYNNELGDLQKELTKISGEFEQLRSDLVLVPVTPAGDIRSYDGLYWFVHNIVTWHQCHLKRIGLAESLDKRRMQAAAILEDINGLFKEARATAIEPVRDVVVATTLRKKLESDEQIWREACLAIDHRRSNIADIQKQLESLEDGLREIYAKSGAEMGDDEKFRKLAAQVEEYKLTAQQCDRLFAVADAREKELKAAPLFSARESELESMTAVNVEERSVALETKTATLDVVNKQIESIRTRIDMVEKGSSLEAALKGMDDTVAELEEEYDNRLASMTGKLLINALKRQADERDRPQVFRTADSLLSRITLGRYGLRLKSGQAAAFAAFDTVEGQFKELEELSTGTRIQLLFSVRLAFLEAQEESISLPLFADELMATSDPVRAGAIMGALEEISREGRQVFYFTSQFEEVDRWQSFLADKGDIPMKLFILGNQENEHYSQGSQRPDPAMGGAHLLASVPDVGGLDHAQYGAVLKPGTFNAMTDDPGRLHVWYMFEDPAVVHSLLRKGLIYWNQVGKYREAGGVIERLDEKIMEVASAKAAILERFLELYRQGRPLRIDRGVLERSGAVSGQYIDEITDLLESLGGDPLVLMESLDNGDIAGFRSKKKDQLKEFFLENQIISSDVELDEQEIWTRLLAFVSRTGISVEDAQSFVTRVLGV